MGLEPTTYCMATRPYALVRSPAIAKTARGTTFSGSSGASVWNGVAAMLRAGACGVLAVWKAAPRRVPSSPRFLYYCWTSFKSRAKARKSLGRAAWRGFSV